MRRQLRAGGLPNVGGTDAANIVGPVGDGVEGVAVGDRVFATGLGLFEDGTYAEYVAAPAGPLAPLDEISFVDGEVAEAQRHVLSDGSRGTVVRTVADAV